MAKQNISNHIRWYWPHHFVFYPVVLFILIICACHTFAPYTAEGKVNGLDNKLLWVAIGIGFAIMTWIAYMLRQHYSLVLQNRIVLLELRYRYFATTGKRFEPIEEQLTDAQLFALRFAPDDELPALAERALCDQLSPKDIKKAVVNWKGDYRRV